MGKKNAKVTIRLRETITPLTSFEGRFLGIITDEDRKACINVKDAASRISTSPSVSLDVIKPNSVQGKYLVFVTDDYREDERIVFITPKVSFTRWDRKSYILVCTDKKDYLVEENNA